MDCLEPFSKEWSDMNYINLVQLISCMFGMFFFIYVVSIEKLMNMNYKKLCLEWNFKGNS